MKKLSLIFYLTIYSSILFAQETERAQKVKTRSNAPNDKVAVETENEPSETIKPGPGKSKGGATQSGARKGWDGTINGPNKLCVCTAKCCRDYVTYIDFGGQGALELNHNEKTTTMVTSQSYNAAEANPKGGNNAVNGLPLKGSTVKGGKNPGVPHRTFPLAPDNTFELPTEWKDGSFKLLITDLDKNTELTIIIEKNGETTKVISAEIAAKGNGSPKQAGF